MDHYAFMITATYMLCLIHNSINYTIYIVEFIAICGRWPCTITRTIKCRICRIVIECQKYNFSWCNNFPCTSTVLVACKYCSKYQSIKYQSFVPVKSTFEKFTFTIDWQTSRWVGESILCIAQEDRPFQYKLKLFSIPNYP